MRTLDVVETIYTPISWSRLLNIIADTDDLSPIVNEALVCDPQARRQRFEKDWIPILALAKNKVVVGIENHIDLLNVEF